jgi:hypothetical protein
MHSRFKKTLIIAFVLTVVLVAAFVKMTESPVEYHKRALTAAEIAGVKASKGQLGIADRIRFFLRRPSTDHAAAVTRHQQALIEYGVLTSRELTLSHDYSPAMLAAFSPSNMLSVGGEFSYIYFAGHQATVIAKPDRIEQLTQWIHEHDTKNR